MFMKTLKEYIQLIEGNDPGPALRSVGVTEPEEDGFDTDTAVDMPQGQSFTPTPQPPLQIEKSYLENEEGYGRLYVAVTSKLDSLGEYDSANDELLRNALKKGGVPMPDENSGVANTTGIEIQIGNDGIWATAFDEAAQKLLDIVQEAGLADEDGNAVVPQEESEEEITEEATDEAVERVVKLSRELRKR